MSDKIVRAITSDGAVMASAITARDLVEQARQLHTTLPTATAALGRSLMAASLMGNQLKGEGDSLTLQIRGGGPLGASPASPTPGATSGAMSRIPTST